MPEPELKQEIALALFQLERLTLAQASRVAEMSQLAFQALLAGAALGERKEELSRLRKEAADFPARLQREVQQAATQAAKDAKQQIDQQALLLKKEAESDRRLAELQIKTLEDLVTRQNAQIADLQKTNGRRQAASAGNRGSGH
jgi:predicted HTH domain antitoxin